jgi:hypothetical protein
VGCTIRLGETEGSLRRCPRDRVANRVAIGHSAGRWGGADNPPRMALVSGEGGLR